MWIVKLVKAPVQNDFRSDFFPRKLYYKSLAMRLVDEVRAKGGEAKAEKEQSNVSQAISR